MRRRIWIYSLWLLLLLLSACQFRPLEEMEFKTDIQVDVDINAVLNVTCDIYNELIPVPSIESEVFRVLFFDTEKDRLLGDSFIYDVYTDPITGNKGIKGNVSIMPGDYRMLIYTFGTESTLISNYDSWEKSQAYTSSLSENELRALSLKALGDEPVNYQPDHLLVASSELESIPYHSGVYTITAEARSVVESYYLQVKVQGLQYVSSARAVLSSMAPSAQLNSRQANCDTPVSLYIDLLKSQDKGEDVVCNVFNTFGRIPDSENELKVTFDIKTVDGRTLTREYEISDLFESELCKQHHWLLIDDVIEVPKPPDSGGSGGGFEPTVGDWEEERHEIEI
ncbi:MAG: DUF5119 domain-containing protein [Candidatus Cryptobacteroides sp.]